MDDVSISVVFGLDPLWRLAVWRIRITQPPLICVICYKSSFSYALYETRTQASRELESVGQGTLTPKCPESASLILEWYKDSKIEGEQTPVANDSETHSVLSIPSIVLHACSGGVKM